MKKNSLRKIHVSGKIQNHLTNVYYNVESILQGRKIKGCFQQMWHSVLQSRKLNLRPKYLNINTWQNHNTPVTWDHSRISMASHIGTRPPKLPAAIPLSLHYFLSRLQASLLFLLHVPTLLLIYHKLELLFWG